MRTLSLENLKAVFGGSCEHENSSTSQKFEDFVDDVISESESVADDFYDKVHDLYHNDEVNCKKRSFLDTFQ